MAGRFVVDIEDAARRDRLFCALTMFAVCDRRPDWNGGHTVAPRAESGVLAGQWWFSIAVRHDADDQ